MTAPRISEDIGTILFFERGANWDGEGAPAISRATVQKAADFYLRVMMDGAPTRPRFISPSRLGGVAFQWNRGERHIVVHVLADGVRFRVTEPGKPAIVGVGAEEAIEHLTALPSLT